MNNKEIITKLPKVDLHRHLDGSVRVETILESAIKHNFKLPTYDVNKLRKYVQVSPKCKSLTEFLKTFDFFYDILKFPDVVERISYEVCEDAVKKENIRYLEVRFAPPLQTNKNFSEEDVVKSVVSGVKYGQKKFGIKVGIILCLYRYHTVTEEQNWKTLKLAEKYFGDGIVGVDLAGDESKYSVVLYKKFFEYANSCGIPITCHAGEAGGPQEVYYAIKFGAKRIGHGTKICKDKKIMEFVKDNSIPLEVCLTSNVQTQVVKDIKKHPVKKLYDYGIKITLNTDDPSVSGIDLNYEFQLAHKMFKFSIEDLKKIVLNAAEACFLDKKTKKLLIQQIKKEMEK